ncbi:MAG: hypothetical protein GY847_37430, partial [Proteobacteria bacterium]|nr:hypothetical protein [Pseudomonadota bacterium]
MIKYDVPEPSVVEADQMVNGKQAHKILLDGAVNLGMAGEPVMPIISARFIIPPESSINDVEVVREGMTQIPGEFTLIHGQVHIPMSNPIESIKETHAVPKSRIYHADSDYPADSHNSLSIQRKRGVLLGFTNINPMIYKPESGRLFYFKTITIKVALKPQDTMAKRNGRIIRPRPEGLDVSALQVLNLDALNVYKEKYKASERRYALSSSIVDPADSFSYVVVTSSAIINATTDYTVHDLITHKNRYADITGTIVDIADVYTNYSGADNAEKLRNFIIDAYNDWGTEYVLLGGDTNYIPVRELYVQACDSGSCFTASIPSDMYYQCLDGDFNYDGDSKWGEPHVDGIGGGDVDLLSEVFIGRASASSADEFANFVYKVITYENDTDVALGALYFGEDSGSGSDGGTTMRELKQGTSSNGFTTLGADSDPAWTSEEYYEMEGSWSLSTAQARINSNQFSIMTNAGHGTVTSCSKFSTSSAAGLSNTNLMFFYSSSCYPGTFTSSCIAESFTTSSRTSMVAGVWNSDLGWYQSGNETNIETQYALRYFWHHFFSGTHELGKLNAYSHESNVTVFENDDFGYWVNYATNLFGDPHTPLVYHDVLPECNDNSDCDDGSWCNGTETCVSEQCVDGSVQCPGQACSEATQECTDGPATKYSWNMDSDPGWTTEGEWAFGQPTGSGGEDGNPDPSSGFTGNNVYGYDLSGDYNDNISETHLTSTAIDCSGFSEVSLKFQQWLGVEENRYDEAYVRVSNDGSNWTTIYTNPSSNLSAGSWEEVEYDISAVADDQATVYLRWTMGSSDSSVAYCGWNIDDIEIIAVGGCEVNADCNDGQFCNGEETCNGGACLAGTAITCDDGAFCNGAETCNESTDSCASGPDPCIFTCNEGSDTCAECDIDSDCNDGVFCNGSESCAGGICVAGSDPCAGQSCDEGQSMCVAGPATQYSWNMNSDPGWTTEGEWAFGQPTGSGGEDGNPDPSAGFTGNNVYGYDLSGDYNDNISETHLTTTA